MTYEVIANFDSRIPSWAGNGTPFTLVACHDTEGGQGRAGALGTIQYLIDTPWRGASYHEIWWYHEGADEFGVIQIVHPSRAAGSIAPQQNVYLPTQWVKDSLGSNWWDPNQGVYAVSIAGRVADVDRYAQNPRFLAHAHRRMLEIRRDLGIERRAEHFQFQPTTRSDWGLNLTAALGGLVIPDELPQETEMLFTYAPRLAMGLPGANLYDAPAEIAFTGTGLAGGPVAVLAEAADGGDWVIVVIPGAPERAMYCHRSGLVNHGGAVDPEVQEAIAHAFNGTAPDAAEVDELTAQVESLTATVATQTQVIADLKTDLGEAEATVAEALTRVSAAEETASEATALRAALVKFLN